MSKTGLTYVENPYDIERHEGLKELVHPILLKASDTSCSEIKNHFDMLDESPTSKVDVRGVILMDKKLLVIQEQADGHCQVSDVL